MIKLIASDLDGTLLHDGMLSDETKATLNEVMSKGIHFVPVTARSYNGVLDWFKENELIKFCGCSNGASIMDNKSKQAIVSSQIPASTVISILDHVSSVNHWWTIDLEGDLYSSSKILEDRDYLLINDRYYSHIVESRSLIDDYHSLLSDKKGVAKIHFITEFKKDKDVLLEALELFKEELCITSSHVSNVEIMHQNASKGGVIEWLKTYYGFAEDEIMVFGDNDNDLSMLKACRYGIAVKDGSEAVKAIAFDQCDEAINHGVACYIKKKVLTKL